MRVCKVFGSVGGDIPRVEASGGLRAHADVITEFRGGGKPIAILLIPIPFWCLFRT
jgi:hypothetical protein